MNRRMKQSPAAGESRDVESKATRQSLSENTLYPHVTLADLDSEVIGRARKLAVTRQPGHPWLAMSDEALIDSAQLRQRDEQRGVNGLTLAAILLFGKDSTILSVLPHHRTDAILRRFNVDRYDDRDDIRTNLIDSYSRLFAFCEKYLNEPFYLEGDQQINLRARIVREVIGNLLIHREYSHLFPAKLVIESKRLFTENGNLPNAAGRIDPKSFSPFRKNPGIAGVFREIGWADESGSGVRKLYRYCKGFCGHDPELIEGEIFRFSLSFVGSGQEASGDGVASRGAEKTTARSSEKAATGGSEKTVTVGSEKTVKKAAKSLQNNELRQEKGSEKGAIGGSEKPSGGSEKTVKKAAKSLQNNELRQEKGSEKTAADGSEKTTANGSEKTVAKIIRLMRENAKISAAKIARKIGISSRAVEKHIAKLKAAGRIKRVGADRGGVWRVL